MSVDYMRQWLINYPKYGRSPGWVARVEAMHTNQVIAVYYRLVNAEK